MASADLYTAFHDRAFFTLKTFKVLLICVVISITKNETEINDLYGPREIRILKALKGHENIKILYLGHNRIGPAAGRELGIWLKACNTIELLDLSHNRLGELIQYPTSICRERVQSAARDIFQGMRKNKSLQTLYLPCITNILYHDSSLCQGFLTNVKV